MKNFFIGRHNELSQLITDLNEGDQFKDPTRIFYLHGEAGIGKKTYYTALWKVLQGNGLDVVWIRPQAFMQQDDPAQWAEMLTDAMTSNREGLQNKINAFRNQWADVPREAGVAVGGGFGSDVSDPHMRDWIELFDSGIASGAGDNSKLRVIFVLDNYEALGNEKKTWFTKSVFEPLVARIPEIDVRFLISGTGSFYNSLDLESYWVPFHSEVKEMELPPLSPDETKEFIQLSKKAIPDGVDVHEKTGGVPAKLIEFLLSGSSSASEEGGVKVEEVDRYFANKSEQERNWIMGAVHLGVFDRESLNIFGTADGAKKALDWLQKQYRLNVSVSADGYRIDTKWVNAILKWQEQKNPEQYRKFAGRVEQFHEVISHIPNYEHRRYLAKLSVFNFFNPDLIANVYDEQAKKLSFFVRNNLHYFIKTAFNFQVSMQYQPFVQNYVRLIPLEDKQELKEKIRYIWDRKKESFETDIKKFEDKLVAEEKEYSSHNELLEPVLNQLKQREKLLKKSRRKEERSKKKKPTKPKKNQPKTLCLILKVLGYAMVLFGVLFIEPASWSFAGYGVLFILLGIYWPESTDPKDMPKPKKPAPRINYDDEEEDTLVGLLNLKKVSLENRSSFLNMNITRFQRKLRELDALINEPYV